MKGCKLWDKITERMNDGKFTIPKPLRSTHLEGGAYQTGDYNALHCRITGKLAEVRVGDAEDHVTKIDLRFHELDYHDPDDQASLGVADLLRSIGLKCRIIPSRGVNCKGVTAKNAVMVFKALAMVPSMDRRLEHCRRLDNSASACRRFELDFFEKTAKKVK